VPRNTALTKLIGLAGTIYGQVSATVKAKKILKITHIYVSSVFSVEAPIGDTTENQVNTFLRRGELK